MKQNKFTLNIILFLVALVVIRATRDKKVPSEEIAVKANVWETKEHGAGDFFPIFTIDGDLGAASSWRGEKIDNIKPWIQYDLGKAVQLSHINIAFFKGDQRSYTIEIFVSEEGNDWVSVFEGTSSGNTAELEKYSIDKSARYIKVVGDGNSNEAFSNWTNITEVEVYLK